MGLSVLHVSQPTEAGVAVCVRELAEDQVRRSWSVTVASPADGDLAEWALSVGAQHVPWDATRDPGPTIPGETTRLRKIVEEVDPDIVHLHSSKAGLAGRAALRGRRPTVFQPHAWSFLAVKGAVRAGALAWERFSARWAHAIVCVSDSERSIGEGARIRGRFTVIPNGIDLERLPLPSAADRERARDDLDLPATPVVLCVGRLSRQKGQDVLLDAWPAITREVPQAALFLVGDGPEMESLTARRPEGVTFVGRSEQVARWLAAADVVVMPSRWEGMSLAMLEAMASGRPLVATDVAGARETMEGAGAIVPIEDVEALANAIVQRLRDPHLAQSEGRAARRNIETNFDLDVTRSAMAELYARLVS